MNVTLFINYPGKPPGERNNSTESIEVRALDSDEQSEKKEIIAGRAMVLYSQKHLGNDVFYK